MRLRASTEKIIISILKTFGQEAFGSADLQGMRILSGRSPKTANNIVYEFNKKGIIKRLSEKRNGRPVYVLSSKSVAEYGKKTEDAPKKRKKTSRTTGKGEFLNMARLLFRDNMDEYVQFLENVCREDPMEIYIKLLEDLADEGKAVAFSQLALRTAMEADASQ